MKNDYPKFYAVKHKNQEVIAKSRSGGIFTAVSDFFLDRGGIVYGCIIDDDFTIRHVRADKKEIRDKMRGSKYVQSDLGDTLKSIKSDLSEGKEVLFTGTPCQVAGLKRFLNYDYDNLFCIDVVCHGVPSPKIWKEYLSLQEKKFKSAIIDFDFRNKKKFGWRDHVETIYFKNHKSVDKREYTKLFFSHYILRESCFECPFKTVHREGDITIADYWKIEKAAPEFDDNKGVSLVLVNSEKGNNIFDCVKRDVFWKETRQEDSMQNALYKSFPVPESRERFWKDYYDRGIHYVVKRYGQEPLRKRIKMCIKKFLKL